MRTARIIIAALACAVFSGLSYPQSNSSQSNGNSNAPAIIQPNWKAPLRRSNTKLTLQVVVNPPLRRGSPIHDAAWKSMRQLNASDARLALWYPYPRLAVAELAPPSKTTTSWNFSLMDPLVADFFAATANRSSVLTISTVPQWMFATPGSVSVPEDPDQAIWNYEQGARLRDESLEEVSTYFERVARWYMQGGFRDESGKQQISGHHYPVHYWEVLNEPEYEHDLSPDYYTRIYDAVAMKLHVMSPRLKFIGMSLAEPGKGTEFFRYFLDPLHHAKGVPVDAISYHFYAIGHPGETQQQEAESLFAQTDGFIHAVRDIEAIRKRLSPDTETQINEAGCIAANDASKSADSMNGTDIPAGYWNLCGAIFAYLYGHLANEGIQVLGASQLLGYPTQYPSVSLLDWTTGKPNARYRVLQLLMKHRHPGDMILADMPQQLEIYAQAFITASGARKIMVVNKSALEAWVVLPGAAGDQVEYVDLTTGNSPPRRLSLKSDDLKLGGFSVSIVTLRTRHGNHR